MQGFLAGFLFGFLHMLLFTFSSCFSTDCGEHLEADILQHRPICQLLSYKPFIGTILALRLVPSQFRLFLLRLARSMGDWFGTCDD